MFGDQPIAIEKSPWYDELEDSPRFGDDEFGLKFALAPARRGDAPTIALLGAYRVSGRVADMYGARVPGALTIVAIDPLSGKVWFNHAERAHGVPISAAMNPDPPPPTPGAAQRIASEGYFNVDLATQLGLPPEKRSYAVFAWLDDFVTPVEMVDLPKHADRKGMAEPIGRSKVKVVHFEDSRNAPKPNEDGSPALAGKPFVGEKGEQRFMLHGAIGSAALEGRADDDPPPALTVVGLSHWDRELRWSSVALPEPALAAKQATFQFDLFHLLNRPERAQAFFVLAAVGKLRSGVLTIPASASKAP